MPKATIILLIFSICLVRSQVPPEVEQTIAQALEGKWVFQNFERKKESMGFASSIALFDIKPGSPFQMYYIDQMSFENAEDDANIDSLMIPMEWYVPLYVKDELQETVMLVGTRFSSEEKWSAGTRSNNTLVETMQAIRKQWPESEGYHPRLVLIAEPYEHNLCFSVPEKEPQNLTIIGQLYRKFKPLPQKVDFSKLTQSKESFRFIKARISEKLKRNEVQWAVKNRINDSLGNLRELATKHLWKRLEEKGNPDPIIPQSAVTSCWMDMVVAADPAIVPENKNKAQLREFKPDTIVKFPRSRMLSMDDGGVEIDKQIIQTARPLRVGESPIDKTISHDEEHWYTLFAEDGNGSIRIGSTGSLQIVDAPYKEGQKWGLGGSISSYDNPKNDADLLEINALSPSHLAIRWNVEKAYLKISTQSQTPVLYRISFVSELPKDRIGGAYGLGVAAKTYIMAVAIGDPADIYHCTRECLTMKQVAELRKRLFGTSESINITSGHRRPDALEINAEGKLHVQHIILSTSTIDGKRKNWAFEIICIRRDGLWLVANAYTDPGLTEKQIQDIVAADYKRMSSMKIH